LDHRFGGGMNASNSKFAKSFCGGVRGGAFCKKHLPGILLLLLAVLSSLPALAWTGRRAVLYARGEAMLAEQLPWKKQDCSAAAWRLMKDLWPELKLARWFKRSTADAMAGWPWAPVPTREQMLFGDLVFAGHPKLNHVLVRWAQPDTAVHAAKSRGFVLTNLKPHWWPKIALIVRPPY
jgi:hypothetical protein